MKLMTGREENPRVSPTVFPKKFRWIIGERDEKAKDFLAFAFCSIFRILFTCLLHDIYSIRSV